MINFFFGLLIQEIYVKCMYYCVYLLYLFIVGIKRFLDDDYEEDEDDYKRRRGDGLKVELRFLLVSKVGYITNIRRYYNVLNFKDSNVQVDWLNIVC